MVYRRVRMAFDGALYNVTDFLKGISSTSQQSRNQKRLATKYEGTKKSLQKKKLTG